MRLPIIQYKNKKWYFDERLRQIRNVNNPHDFKDVSGDEFFSLLYLSKVGKRRGVIKW